MSQPTREMPEGWKEARVRFTGSKHRIQMLDLMKEMAEAVELIAKGKRPLDPHSDQQRAIEALKKWREWR